MLVLIFDTETTGLPTDYKLNGAEHPDAWAYIVQFSFILFNTETQKCILEYDEVISNNRNGVVIDVPTESTEIHGITAGMCEKRGVPIKCALEVFMVACDRADKIVAHNMHFDINCVYAELSRLGWTDQIFKLSHISYKFICTMRTTTQMCGLEHTSANGRRFIKFPTLLELHRHLFGTVELRNLHNSFNDILVCLRCYYKLETGEDIIEKNRHINKMMRPILA